MMSELTISSLFNTKEAKFNVEIGALSTKFTSQGLEEDLDDACAVFDFSEVQETIVEASQGVLAETTQRGYKELILS